ICLLAGTTDARGYRQWAHVGRHVDKGAKAIRILAPLSRTITETDAETGEESKRTLITGFKTIPVFAIESTSGLSVEPVDYRPAIFPPLYDVAEKLGVRVDYGPSAGRFRGYYCPADERFMLVAEVAVSFFHELWLVYHRRVL